MAERDRPSLDVLARAALDEARGDEAVEAYAEEGRRTEVSALRGEVEGITVAESRGVGVRVIRDARLGYAWVADPSLEEVRAAVRRARENAELAEPDPANGLPEPEPAEPLPQLHRPASARAGTDETVARALDLEAYATSRDPRVTRVDLVQVGDAVSAMHVASTSGVDVGYERTDAWCVVVALASDGEETQTGFSFAIGRGWDEVDPHPVADEAVERGVRVLGATKPATARVPVVLDRYAATAFLGVLASVLSAEEVLKGRSPFAGRLGDRLGSELVTIVDDGRILAGPGACPVDDEGVPTARTELVAAGVLAGFLHDTYTARRTGGDQRSTGNARRGFRSPPSVGATNLYLDAGPLSLDELLARAEGGVLIQEVSGVHSGVNPVSGEFSVGATGLRVTGGALGEPLREMTIASTIPEMLLGVTGVGSDLRFLSNVGTPSVLIGEMTLAGR